MLEKVLMVLVYGTTLAALITSLIALFICLAQMSERKTYRKEDKALHKEERAEDIARHERERAEDIACHEKERAEDIKRWEIEYEWRKQYLEKMDLQRRQARRRNQHH